MAPVPPGPRGLSPLGILPAFARDPLDMVTQVARRYGDCVLLRGPLGMRGYLLNDPDLIRTVLATHADKIEKPAPLKWIFRSSFGNGLLLSEGSFWKRQRKLAQPAFHSKRIQGYADAMVWRAQQLLASWQDGQVRDIREDMSATTLQIVVDALFQSTVAEETAQIYAALAELGDILAQQSITNPLLSLVPDWAPLPVMRRKRRAAATLDAIVYRFIHEHRQSTLEQGDLLALLMLAQDDAGQHMSDQQLHDEVMTLFIAGHETTALTLAWAFVLLAQHPAAAAKLYAELDSTLAGRPPSLADLPHLPYTALVVKETLRLYPPAWLILRQTIASITLGPYHLPKGTQIWICPYTMHRHQRFYSDPEEFYPDRFSPDALGDKAEARLPSWAYIPFGGGPRMCIGAAFAQIEAQLLLATIAQQYRMEPQPGAPIKLRVGAALGFEQGAVMRVVRRG